MSAERNAPSRNWAPHWSLGALALVATAATVFAFMTATRAAAESYLFALTLLATLLIGATLSLLIGHATDAGWFVAVRRPLEVVAGCAPALLGLAIPVVVCAGAVYPWLSPQTLSQQAARAVRERGPLLSGPLDLVQDAVLLVAVVAVAEFLIRQGSRAGAEPRRRMVRASAVLLPIFGLVVSFLAFDALMSLDPEFYSTIYGAYVLAGAFSGATALQCLVLFMLRRAGNLSALRGAHFHALGRVLLASVCVWAYFAYAQFYIVWIADVPAEASYFLTRATPQWKGVALGLVLTQFAVPFIALLSRRLKFSPRALACVASIVLLGHTLDVYWLVVPAFGPNATPSWTLAPTCVCVFSLASWVGAWRARRTKLLPEGDPRLSESLAYQSS
ncbi:MAG: hypothetical protein R3B89_32675 [Polyangiaceae bacterium]